MSSGKTLKNQLALTEKIKLPVFTELGQEIQIDFSGKLHSELVTGEPFFLIRIDWYSKWPVVWV